LADRVYASNDAAEFDTEWTFARRNRDQLLMTMIGTLRLSHRDSDGRGLYQRA
jgi:hypothetical protein